MLIPHVVRKHKTRDARGHSRVGSATRSTMAILTAPDEEDVIKAVKRVFTVGLALAEQESLAALQTIASASEAASGRTVDLKHLLETAIARCAHEDARKHLPTMLDLQQSGCGPGERQRQIAAAMFLAEVTVRTDKRRAWATMLARALLEMFAEARERTRGRFEVGEVLRTRFEQLCTLAALQLAASRNRDGSWAATPCDRAGELSTTTRAVASLHKALGADWAEPRLAKTLDWIGAHYDEVRGAYGDCHYPGAPPGFPKEQQIVPQPRQTASAIKIVRQFQGPGFRAVGRGVQYLIENQAQGNIGWAKDGHKDDHKEPADVLTTAYVLDALLAIQPDLRHTAAGLERPEFDVIDDQFDRAVRRGVDWLLERSRHGGWPADGGPEPDPYVTAQVLGFAWQVVVPDPGPTIDYLSGLCDGGGIPARADGPPEPAPTAMALLGLLRATTEGHEALLLKAANYLGRVAVESGMALDVFAATFALLLGQPTYEWLSGKDWQERAGAGVDAIFDGVRAKDPPQAVARAAVEQLQPCHRPIEPVLAQYLELHR
jgi:hypothetical protein